MSMTTIPKKNSQHGFSLLEVLIAVVVMSLGLLALASLQSSLIRSAADAKAQSLAMAVAKQRIELLQSAESFGGNETCVSPIAWTGTNVSCYRMVTDQASTAVDGDPTTTATDPLGGINFTMTTGVTRYVFNKATNLYVSVSDTATSTSLQTSPTTYIPGKEFKRISVTVNWTDATNAARSVTVEDAIAGVVPRDSIALLLGKKGVLPRKAEAIIINPGSVAGVIPIAIGNGSNTAASNPTPELLGAKNNTYVAETRFDVYSYIPLNETTALAQSRVETAVVGCRCDTAAASTTEIPLRPTYWEGLRYAVPSEANYVGLTTAAPTKNYPLAGPKALSGGELPQSEQCRVCCRDHHDPAGNDPNGDPYSSYAKVSPRRGSHTHNLVDPTTGALTPVTTGVYSEVCRMIRVDGIFRVAADLNNDYFALLEARNSGVSSFVPSTEVADDYGDMVKKYLKARFSDNSTPSTFNTTSSPDPYSNTYVQGTRTLADFSTRTYDLNLPASYTIKLTEEARWLHARGLYIDYLEPQAVARLVAAQDDCASSDTNECVLPYLPFTSINLTELAEWQDVAVTPDPASTAQVISVLNNGFNTATGDATYVTNADSGATGSKNIGFSVDVDDGVVEGMAVSGTGIAPNARIVSINNQRDAIVVDLANTATVSGDVIFQATPVRGIVQPGTAPGTGDEADALATASYNNAAVALQFPMNSDETVLTDPDNQRFVLSASGSPPDPTAGSFDVTFDTSQYTVDSNHPKVAWGVGNATPSIVNSCNLVGSALPFICPASSGLNGSMSILIGDYNIGGLTKNYTLDWNVCKVKSGGSYVAYTGTHADTVQLQPYVLNFKVASAVTTGVSGSGVYSPTGSSPFTVVGSPTATGQTTGETTELNFQNIALPVGGVKDLITVNLVKETAPDDEIEANLVCCLIKISGSTHTLSSITWAPNACPFP